MTAPTIDGSKVLTDVTAKVVEDGIKALWGKVKDFFVDTDRKQDIDLGIPFEKYLRKTRENYGSIKSILYNKTRQDLLSIYECLDLEYNGVRISSKSVRNITEIGHKIIITGTGGLGKSTMLKYFFLNTIGLEGYIPVMLELRMLNNLKDEEISLRSAVYQMLTDNGFELEDKYFEYSLKRGGYIILLDGYDELKYEIKDRVGASIRSFANKYSDNYFIVSSRPSEEFISWNDFTELESKAMTKQQALSLVSRIKAEDAVKNKFKEELTSTLFKKHQSFAENPLLLTIMFMTYRNHAAMPEKLNEFYEQAYLVLFNEHDATKDCFKRDIRTGLGAEDFKLVFSYICFQSYFADEFDFTDATLNEYIEKAKKKVQGISFQNADFRDDLTKSVCMLVKDGLSYHFSHRSFQDYFAAYYTCKLIDVDQVAVLNAYIKKHHSEAVSNNFFYMLFEFQSEKVNKLIFLPELRKVQEQYIKYGFSIDLLSHLASTAIIRFHSKNSISSTVLLLDEISLRAIIPLAMRCNGFRRVESSETDEITKSICEKLMKTTSYPNDKLRIYEVKYTFEELSEILTTDEILYTYRWVQQDCDNILELIKRYDKPDGSKDTLKDILADL